MIVNESLYQGSQFNINILAIASILIPGGFPTHFLVDSASCKSSAVYASSPASRALVS